MPRQAPNSLYKVKLRHSGHSNSCVLLAGAFLGGPVDHLSGRPRQVSRGKRQRARACCLLVILWSRVTPHSPPPATMPGGLTSVFCGPPVSVSGWLLGCHPEGPLIMFLQVTGFRVRVSAASCFGCSGRCRLLRGLCLGVNS